MEEYVRSAFKPIVDTTEDLPVPDDIDEVKAWVANVYIWFKVSGAWRELVCLAHQYLAGRIPALVAEGDGPH